MSGEMPAGGLRLGPAEIVKGGARVDLVASDPSPVEGPEPGPILSDHEAAQAGLFQSRLIEFGETRLETVVGARPFVREELVVGRSVGRRVERIDETVRRTEVEVEKLSSRTGKESS